MSSMQEEGRYTGFNSSKIDVKNRFKIQNPCGHFTRQL